MPKVRGNCAAGGRVLAHSILFRHQEIGDKFPETLTNAAGSSKIERVLPKSGPVAQLGARFHGMEEVIGSIPIRSTNKLFKISDLEWYIPTGYPKFWLHLVANSKILLQSSCQIAPHRDCFRSARRTFFAAIRSLDFSDA